MYNANARSEANDQMSKGTKLITTSFFKPKGDWLNATPMFERAAMLYRQGKVYHLAREAYEKAATGQQRQKSPWHGAKNLEKAGEMANEMKDWPGVQDTYSRAAELYCEEGRQSNAAEALSKAARLLEEQDPKAAAKLYEKAIGYLEDSDKDVVAGDTYRQAIGHLLRTQQWHAAVSMLTRFAVSCDKSGASASQCKAYLGAVIVWLYAGDAKNAWKTYQDALTVDCFMSCDEAFAAEALFDAYRSASEEAITGVIKEKLTFNHLDNQMVRLARKLPGGKVDLQKMAGELGGQRVFGGGGDDDEAEVT